MRVASFNVMHGRSLTDGRVDADRFRAAIAELDCDVLALQEVDVGQPRSGGADLAATAAAALGVDEPGWRFIPTVFGTPGLAWRPAEGERRDGEPAYGIALVSRLPVRDWQVLPLGRAPMRSPILIPRGNSHSKMIMMDDEPRVALVATVEAPDGPVTVVNTHLSFVPGWNAFQLRRLVRRLARVAGPVLLAGDLNLPGRLPEIVSGWRRLAAVATYPGHAPRVQLDHVLARGPVGTVTAAEARRSTISDHLPLVVDLARRREA